ncbi:MAG: hypothetical protein MN733_35945, partial [Nitrososphaera sp.]|nr:hypothetical protein [Nitrososphaera sp.]
MTIMIKILKVLLLLSLQIPIFPSLENQWLECTDEMTLDLLDETLPHIQNHIYPRKIALNEWKYKDGDVPGAAADKFNDKSWRSVQLPFQWGGYDKFAWFRTEAAIPQEFSGQPLALVIDLPESLLYLNGSAYQGIDGTHQEVFLTAKARGNQKYSIAIQSYNGRKVAPSTFQFAHLAVVYAPARSLYFALKTLRDLSNAYGNQAVESKDIREIIRRTLIYLKYFKPEGEEYPNAIGRALNFLLGALGTEFTTQVPGLAHLIGSSRLSPALQWTTRAVPRKTAQTFSNAFRLMEEYPEFVFGQPQAYLYSTLEQRFPDVFKGVRQRVTEGRWEPLGGMWVE